MRKTIENAVEVSDNVASSDEHHVLQRLLDYVSDASKLKGKPLALTFSKIDADKVQQLLNVSDFRGIETALKDMYNALSTEEQSDIFWLIHWLDRNDLKYDYIKNEMK